MFNEVLNKFLSNQAMSSEEEELLIKEVNIIVFFAVESIGKQLLYQIYEKDSMYKEILNETFITLIEKKELIIHKTTSGNTPKSYIKFIVKNNLIDKLRKKRLNFELLDDEFSTNEIKSKKELLLYLEAVDFVKISKNILTFIEKEALCYELINKIPPNKSKSSFNKAKNRAKNRLKQLVKNNGFPIDVVEFSLKRLFMSKICNDFVNDIRS